MKIPKVLDPRGFYRRRIASASTLSSLPVKSVLTSMGTLVAWCRVDADIDDTENNFQKCSSIYTICNIIIYCNIYIYIYLSIYLYIYIYMPYANGIIPLATSCGGFRHEVGHVGHRFATPGRFPVDGRRRQFGCYSPLEVCPLWLYVYIYIHKYIYIYIYIHIYIDMKLGINQRNPLTS